MELVCKSGGSLDGRGSDKSGSTAFGFPLVSAQSLRYGIQKFLSFPKIDG